jgi:hypothetical protein
LSGHYQTFVRLRIWISPWYAANLAFKGKGTPCHFMKKKNWFLIIIILVAILLIATVIWFYAKRIEHIESKMKISTISVRAKLLLHI